MGSEREEAVGGSGHRSAQERISALWVTACDTAPAKPGGGYGAAAATDAADRTPGRELKIRLVDKAAMERSGAVAQGLSAINTYIGPEQDPADYARMVSNDLMSITRDDVAYDLGRHVDESERRQRVPLGDRDVRTDQV